MTRANYIPNFQLLLHDALVVPLNRLRNAQMANFIAWTEFSSRPRVTHEEINHLILPRAQLLAYRLPTYAIWHKF